MQNALAIINAIPFLLAALMIFPAIRQTLKTTGMAFLTGGTMLALFLWFATYIPDIGEGPVELVIEWVPALGLSLAWYLDPLSLLFGLIVTGVGIAVFFYSGFYLEEADELGRFYMYLCAFAGAMLGLVMAGNIITLFIAWELTSIMSYLLIGFKGYKSREARTAASRALVITGAGGLALLGGLLLLGTATNNIIASGDIDLTAPVVETAHGEEAITEVETEEEDEDAETLTISDVEVPVLGFQISTVLNGNIREPLQDHPWYAAIVILIMIGCFTKSAQFPVPFLAPRCDDRPFSGKHLFTLRDDGEGGHLPAVSSIRSTGEHRPVDVRPDGLRPDHDVTRCGVCAAPT
jgi:NADH:ubiquinone oxidoreductase subunit 5 (subunit L)/multisubunit Na+/H+ antiporter MnhA subunit